MQTQEQMVGVVVWADARDSRAVVWCEDQGHLAFYRGADQSMHEGLALDPGDLIQFDLHEGQERREVNNPRLLGAGVAPQLAERLKEYVKPAKTKPEPPRAANSYGDNVVAFPGARC